MDVQLVRRIAALEKRLDGLQIPEKSLLLAAPFFNLPVLRGLWVTSVDSAGDWHDISGHGNHLGLNGDPQFDYDGLAPYWALDGAGDYFNITDAASGNDYDILGTEAYVGTPGLTFGGWYWFDNIGAFEYFASKDGGVGQYAYWLRKLATDAIQFQISVDGTNVTSVSSGTDTYANAAWHFITGVYYPSTEMRLMVDGNWYSNAAAIPASIFNSTADFVIGGRSGGAGLLTGRASASAVYASAASDAMVGGAFQATRALFGV